MTTGFVLYGTQHCHLCDDAKTLLHQLSFEFEYVDIAQSEPLMVAYGTRIPVLFRSDTNAELGWPFDVSLLENFLI